jgi:hypothetical protein
LQVAPTGFEVGEVGGRRGDFVVQAQGFDGIGAPDELSLGLTVLLVQRGDVALEGVEFFLDVALVAAELLRVGFLAAGWRFGARWTCARRFLAFAVVDRLVDRIPTCAAREMVVQLDLAALALAFFGAGGSSFEVG